MHFLMSPTSKRKFKEMLLSNLQISDNYFLYDYNLTFTANQQDETEIILRSQRKIIQSTLQTVANEFNLVIVGYQIEKENLRKYKYYLKYRGENK